LRLDQQRDLLKHTELCHDENALYLGIATPCT
jgi:hypothetical protein